MRNIIFFTILLGLGMAQCVNAQSEVVTDVIDSTYTVGVTASFNGDGTVTLVMDYLNIEGQYVTKVQTVAEATARNLRRDEIDRLNEQIESANANMLNYKEKFTTWRSYKKSLQSQKQAWRNITIE